MGKIETTYIVKRAQLASDGKNIFIVRQIAGSGGNLGVTYIYSEEHMKEWFGEDAYDNGIDDLTETLDEDKADLRAVKVTITAEIVPAKDLFTNINHCSMNNENKE